MQKLNDGTLVFFPETTGPYPVYYFGHGRGGDDWTNYGKFIDYLLLSGLAVVYVPHTLDTNTYQDPHPEGYDILLSGFENARSQLGDQFTKSCIAGHSFGAGAIPYIAKHMPSDALHVIAPGYSFDTSDAELVSVGAGRWSMFNVLERERVNDPRMAMDLHSYIGGSFTEIAGTHWSPSNAGNTRSVRSSIDKIAMVLRGNIPPHVVESYTPPDRRYLNKWDASRNPRE
jgi:hypothetical protein